MENGTCKFVAYLRLRYRSNEASLEAQRTAVLNYLRRGDWHLVAEFTEIERPRNERREFKKALAACKKTNASLIIAELGRLSRDTRFLAALMESCVDFVALDHPEVMRHNLFILADRAQHAHELVGIRTLAVRQAARTRGKALDSLERLAAARRQSNAAKKKLAAQFAAAILPIIREIQRTGVNSLRGIARELAARDTPTFRGGAWTAVQVRAILRRPMLKIFKDPRAGLLRVPNPD